MEKQDRTEGLQKTVSRQQRKIDQQKQTIDHLHDRMARLQSSKRNKASQIARLKAENEKLNTIVKAFCKLVVESALKKWLKKNRMSE